MRWPWDRGSRARAADSLDPEVLEEAKCELERSRFDLVRARKLRAEMREPLRLHAELERRNHFSERVGLLFQGKD